MNEKRFALKAVNDEETTCCVCGKVELKRVMWIVELSEDGEEIADPFHCGTTCGAKLLGYKLSRINKAVKSFNHMVYKERQRLIDSHPGSKKERELIKQLNELGLFGKERREHSIYQEMKAAKQEAIDWANDQQINVEI